LDTFAAVNTPENGEPVITSRNPTVFAIEPVGDDRYIIKIPYADLLWNVESPVMPHASIKLRSADGSYTQAFTLEAIQLL
jgi:hypothetical protein